jgi:plasmid stabilization system protein ParE
MALEIQWTQQALADLFATKVYILETWGETTLHNFLDILEQKLNLISSMPESCVEISERKGVRKCVLSPQNSLYYRVFENQIEIDELQILRIFDNRQNPKKLKL